ncbi:MAG: hypothetical protein R3284_04965 [Rubricoccaceae bacterium]|nr:hypothetical protein [Rubricoccaceae bacterium]
MSVPSGSSRRASNKGYWCHAALAVIVCICLAMQIHLRAIDASPSVVGGGVFLVVIWLGLPAIVLAILGTYFAIRATDIQLLCLSFLLLVLMVAGARSSSIITGLGVFYVLLVVIFGLLRCRERKIAIKRTD